jgi:hypothetical protein
MDDALTQGEGVRDHDDRGLLPSELGHHTEGHKANDGMMELLEM